MALNHPRSRVEKFVELYTFEKDDAKAEAILEEARAYIRKQDQLKPATIKELYGYLEDGIEDRKLFA